MTDKKVTHYGTWPSPITADLVARSSRGISQLHAQAGILYWIEQLPEQKGRRVIMSRDQRGNLRELTGLEYNVRNRVHEYGGGDYTVHEGTLYFINDSDQRLYRQDKNHAVTVLTALPEKSRSLRYADPVVTPDGSHVICVREVHNNEHDVKNEIVSIPTDGSLKVTVLASGNDFYAAPKVSSDGKQLLFLTWNHPQMPWDGTYLYLADLNQNIALSNHKLIAGDINESICQPTFNDQGEIYFVSDKANWWNLYRYTDGEITRVLMIDAEVAYPAWIFATRSYILLEGDRIFCLLNEKGSYALALIDGEQITRIATEYDSFEPYLARIGHHVFCIGGHAAAANAILQVDVHKKSFDVLHSSSTLLLDSGYFSLPERIEFKTDNGKTAYAYFYSPQNPCCIADEKELPPLIVTCHGGPTAAASSGLNLKIQYWTSRGFALVDVNYGGSTGYGRAYRDRLKGNWGVIDVADCVNAAKYLVAQGRVDPKRLAIRGSSAGGLTVLSALTFYDIFSAGASYYGVADLEGLLTDTHKFESHYLETLVGAYPEKKAIYQARSPLRHADQLNTPIIFLQGMEDKVVSPAQPEAMIAALEKKRLPYAYVTFPREQHGFRDSASVKKALEAEYSFYAQIFGFKPTDAIRTVSIHHL